MKHQPFAILTFVLVWGILISYYFQPQRVWLWGAIGILGAGVIICKWLYASPKLFTLLGLMLVLFIGMVRYQQVELTPEKAVVENNALLQVKVLEMYKPSEKYAKYKTAITKSTDSALIGQHMLLYVKKSQPTLHAEDFALIMARMQQIPSPKNPHAFDYQKLMQRKGISWQSFNDTLYTIQHPPNWQWKHDVAVFKSHVKAQLQAKSYSTAANLFVTSLGLGDRSGFDKNIQETLSAVGIMHLFAISGLHLGIVFTWVMIMLYPLLFINNGKPIRVIIALVIIWIYAAFVDFSPSVTRAAFMISVYYITVLLKRPTNLIHTLFFSAFVLLCIDPHYIFDVGFQLSYAAVFFIAWLYKPIRNFFPKYRQPWKNKIWDILGVTMAAQLGVMPISIFYFHQFSGLFLLGNVLLIPLASILVISSMLIVVMVALEWEIPYSVEVTNWIFDSIIMLIEKLATVDDLVFKNLSISMFQLFICMAMVYFIRPLLLKFRWRRLMPVLSLLCLFQITRLYTQYKCFQKEELLVFNQYKGTIIGLRHANTLAIFWDVEDSIQATRYIIQPYVLKEQIKKIQFFPLQADANGANYIKNKGLIKFKNQHFYIVQSRVDTLPEVDYIIGIKGHIHQRTFISPQTKRIITDASNYPSIIKRLKENSDKIYATAIDGAYVFTVDSINRQTPHTP